MTTPSPLPRGRVLVAGCGFTGLVVSRLLHEQGWEVVGLTERPDSARGLASEPFDVVAVDINDRDTLSELGAFDAVIDCVSSGRGGAEAYRTIYLDGARSLLETICPKRFLFASSTSVYAQTDGSIVTEESPATPDRETGQILRATEDLVLQAGGQVIRLAGLFAPGRWATLEKFLRGEAVIEGDGSRVINQIHRDDAASAFAFLLGHTLPAGIYNATDGCPLTQRELYTEFATHFGRPVPPAGPIDLNRKRGWTSKRVSNAKLTALGWQPRYQTFQQALLGELTSL